MKAKRENKKALFALGVVAVIAIIGMVMMFNAAITGNIIDPIFKPGDRASVNAGLQPWQQQVVARDYAARNQLGGQKAIVDPTFKPVSN